MPVSNYNKNRFAQLMRDKKEARLKRAEAAHRARHTDTRTEVERRRDDDLEELGELMDMLTADEEEELLAAQKAAVNSAPGLSKHDKTDLIIAVSNEWFNRYTGTAGGSRKVRKTRKARKTRKTRR